MTRQFLPIIFNKEINLSIQKIYLLHFLRLYMNKEEQIKKRTKLINELLEMGIKNEKVINAIRKIPREKFVAEDQKDYAYENIPLSIPSNQTISQPYTVAYMIELLEIKRGNKILEIGTGSGYNATLLKTLAGKNGEVYSIEIIEELNLQAKENLKNAKIKDVNLILGDGNLGYKEKAPFDRIIITAATKHIPKNLIDQLKDGGIFVAPIEKSGSYQVMTKIIKKDGRLITTEHGFFNFVPMTSSSNHQNK